MRLSFARGQRSGSEGFGKMPASTVRSAAKLTCSTVGRANRVCRRRLRSVRFLDRCRPAPGRLSSVVKLNRAPVGASPIDARRPGRSALWRPNAGPVARGHHVRLQDAAWRAGFVKAGLRVLIRKPAPLLAAPASFGTGLRPRSATPRLQRRFTTLTRRIANRTTALYPCRD